MASAVSMPDDLRSKLDTMNNAIDLTDIRDIGSSAIWTLSSCKAGCGVHQLRDNTIDTFWQSDGPQPHLVNIQLLKRTSLYALAIYADYKHDESYTPSKISVRTGTHLNDLEELCQRELNEPSGWQVIDLRVKLNHDGLPDNGENCQLQPCRAFVLQLAVLNNHQNGRDTHVRQMRLFSPTVPIPTIGHRLRGDMASNAEYAWNLESMDAAPFKTSDMLQFTACR